MGEKSYVVELSETDRLRFHISMDHNVINSVVIQYETEINGRYCPIVRYDTAHGFFHRDIMAPDGGDIAKDFVAFFATKEAIDFAYKDLRYNWRQYREAFK